MIQNNLIKREKFLPVTIDNLTNFVLIGRERLTAVRAEMRARKKIGFDTDEAKNIYEMRKSETQDMAEELLDAESMLGELLKEKVKAGNPSIVTSGEQLPEGITRKQSHYFQLMSNHPEIIEQVKVEARENEDLPTRTEVIRKIKQKENEIKNNKLRNTFIKNINGLYDVIVIDPPWEMNKIDRDCSPEQTGFDYPTMSLDEIKSFKLPAENDCHLFLWTTQKYLPESFNILNAWDFNYILTFVWHKNGGFQPFGLPQYNNEFCIYGRKGFTKFIETSKFNTCFSANRTGHSNKPDEFYETIRRVTAGKRIDIFNRRNIDGFDMWGNQSK